MVKRSWAVIPDIRHMDQTMELVKDYDVIFEYNDFMFPHILDNKEMCSEMTQFYKSLDRDRSRDTMHGAFLDITVHSTDRLIREASEKRVRQCMEIAEELGIRGVVFHTNLIANFRAETYYSQWLKSNVKFWSCILEEFPGQEVYLENMFEENSRMCVEIGKAMEGEPRFGLCLDYAHAMAFGKQKIGDWFMETAPYIRHMHINDNDCRDDLHLPVGAGCIDWERYGYFLEKCGTDVSVLIEVKSCEGQRASLEYLSRKGILQK